MTRPPIDPGRLRTALTGRRAAALVAGACLAAALLAWLGFGAVREWQRSQTLLAERRAQDAVDRLATALGRDMQGVERSVLPAWWERLMLDPPEDGRKLAAGAFARYPYPESFFAWRGEARTDSSTAAAQRRAIAHPVTEDGNLPPLPGERGQGVRGRSAGAGAFPFYTRRDRRPAWIAAEEGPARFPVITGEAPDVAEAIRARVATDVRRGRPFSIFDMTLGGEPYQIVVRLFYRDPFHERLAGAIGFTVNLRWAEAHYFPEMTREVARIGRPAPFVLRDHRGAPIVGPDPAGDATTTAVVMTTSVGSAAGSTVASGAAGAAASDPASAAAGASASAAASVPASVATSAAPSDNARAASAASAAAAHAASRGVGRDFPLLFFDPRLVSLEPPPDLARLSWRVEVDPTADESYRAAMRGARQTLILAAAAVAALVSGLLLSARAARESAQVARMRTEFVSAVTHELKTPLATIRVIGQTLAGGRVADARALRDYAHLIVQEAKRLTRLVENLLAYARVTDVADVYAFEPIDLRAAVEEALNGFAPQLTEGGFDVRVEIADDLPAVRADHTALRLVLDNLVDNAMRYSGPSRWLRLAGRLAGDRSAIVIEVSDGGVGIPTDELAQVTRRFFRGQRHRSAGSGLGLTIVDRIVADHGGRLDIRSEVDKGTTVAVTLPAAREEDDAADTRG